MGMDTFSQGLGQQAVQNPGAVQSLLRSAGDDIIINNLPKVVNTGGLANVSNGLAVGIGVGTLILGSATSVNESEEFTPLFEGGQVNGVYYSVTLYFYGRLRQYDVNYSAYLGYFAIQNVLGKVSISKKDYQSGFGDGRSAVGYKITGNNGNTVYWDDAIVMTNDYRRLITGEPPNDLYLQVKTINIRVDRVDNTSVASDVAQGGNTTTDGTTRKVATPYYPPRTAVENPSGVGSGINTINIAEKASNNETTKNQTQSEADSKPAVRPEIIDNDGTVKKYNPDTDSYEPVPRDITPSDGTIRILDPESSLREEQRGEIITNGGSSKSGSLDKPDNIIDIKPEPEPSEENKDNKAVTVPVDTKDACCEELKALVREIKGLLKVKITGSFEWINLEDTKKTATYNDEGLVGVANEIKALSELLVSINDQIIVLNKEPYQDGDRSNGNKNNLPGVLLSFKEDGKPSTYQYYIPHGSKNKRDWVVLREMKIMHGKYYHLIKLTQGMLKVHGQTDILAQQYAEKFLKLVDKDMQPQKLTDKVTVFKGVNSKIKTVKKLTIVSAKYYAKGLGDISTWTLSLKKLPAGN